MAEHKRPHRGYVQQAENGEWYWLVKASNGKELERSSETYVRWHYALDQIQQEHPGINVQINNREHPDADIRVIDDNGAG